MIKGRSRAKVLCFNPGGELSLVVFLALLAALHHEGQLWSILHFGLKYNIVTAVGSIAVKCGTDTPDAK